MEHIPEGYGGELRKVGGIDKCSGHGVDRARRGYSDSDRTTGTDLFKETVVHRTDRFDHGLGGLVGGGGATGLGEDGRWGVGEGSAQGRATYVDAKHELRRARFVRCHEGWGGDGQRWHIISLGARQDGKAMKHGTPDGHT